MKLHIFIIIIFGGTYGHFLEKNVIIGHFLEKKRDHRGTSTFQTQNQTEKPSKTG
jgi:hypothetical protein